VLTHAVESYLAVRRTMGFALHSEGTLLQSFAKHSDAAGKSHICAETAIQWAAVARTVNTRARRLGQVIRLGSEPLSSWGGAIRFEGRPTARFSACWLARDFVSPRRLNFASTISRRTA
jgi:hypothetical protein